MTKSIRKCQNLKKRRQGDDNIRNSASSFIFIGEIDDVFLRFIEFCVY